MIQFDTITDKIIEYLRENIDKIFRMPPDKVVEQIIDGIRAYEPLSKMYIKSNWNVIKPYLTRPARIMEIIKAKDPKLYAEMMEHVDWLNEFFLLLYRSIKKYMST